MSTSKRRSTCRVLALGGMAALVTGGSVLTIAVRRLAVGRLPL